MIAFMLTNGLTLSRVSRLSWQPSLTGHEDNVSIMAVETLTLAQKREISTAFRNAIEASASGEVVLVFATITHADLPQPIRVVSEDFGGVSFNKGEPLNYKYEGNLFLGCPFLIELLTDDDQPPRGRVTVPDVDRTIGIEVMALIDSPRIKIEILKLSDFTDAIDIDNARNPVGTPVPEYVADLLYLKNVSGDAVAVQAELQSFDLVGEPWPLTRSTSDRLPALFE